MLFLGFSSKTLFFFFFLELSASLAFFCEVAEAEGGISPWKQAPVPFSIARAARRGSVLSGSLAEGATVWKPSPRGHPVMLDVLFKRKHVYGKGG